MSWYRKDTRPADVAIREVLQRLPDRRPPRSPKPVHHGRRCGDCANWMACKPIVGSLYANSAYCFRPDVGPNFP